LVTIEPLGNFADANGAIDVGPENTTTRTASIVMKAGRLSHLANVLTDPSVLCGTGPSCR